MRVFAQAISLVRQPLRCKRREDDWLNHAVPACLQSWKALQMWPFRGVRRRASWRPTRPVTPEVADEETPLPRPVPNSSLGPG
jgi:hypothetical protein